MATKKTTKADVKEAAKNIKEETKKVAEKASAKAKEEVKAAKENAAKAVEKAPAKTEEIKNEVKKSAAKAKKDAKEVATAAKKSAKKTAQKLVTKDVYFEFSGKQVNSAELSDMAEKAYVALGNKASSIKSMKLYVKAEDSAMYYVVNGKDTGKVEL